MDIYLSDLTKKDRNLGPIKDKELVESIFQLMLKDLQLMKEWQGELAWVIKNNRSNRRK